MKLLPTEEENVLRANREGFWAGLLFGATSAFMVGIMAGIALVAP